MQQHNTLSDGPRGAISPANDEPKQGGRRFDCGAELVAKTGGGGGGGGRRRRRCGRA